MFEIIARTSGTFLRFDYYHLLITEWEFPRESKNRLENHVANDSRTDKLLALIRNRCSPQQRRKSSKDVCTVPRAETGRTNNLKADAFVHGKIMRTLGSRQRKKIDTRLIADSESKEMSRIVGGAAMTCRSRPCYPFEAKPSETQMGKRTR